jgi:hypothetical protein
MSTEYADQVFEYHQNAFEYSQQGEFATAASMWQQILDDEAMTQCFTAEGIADIAFNCAAAHYFAGQQDEYQAIVADHGLSEAQCAHILAGAQGQ